MIRPLKLFLFALGLSFAGSSFAIIPENGWWWSANESGRGFNIEVQNNSLFFAAFAYEPNGAPTWLTAGGTMSSDRDFSGSLTKFSSGQCFGCSYSAPVSSPAGNLTLRFTSSQEAVLTINGTSISVKRFDFWLNEVYPDAMLGEWSAIIGSASSSTFDGERIDFPRRTSDSSGPILTGYRLGSTSNAAVLSYNGSRGVFTALLDSSASFYRYFEFIQTGFNRVEGNFWLLDKGSQPVGSGTFFQAYRTASAAFVQTGRGPASTKSATIGDSDARDATLAAALAKVAGPEAKAADAAVVDGFHALQQRMKEARP